jgi:hypothetical protein
MQRPLSRKRNPAQQHQSPSQWGSIHHKDVKKLEHVSVGPAFTHFWKVLVIYSWTASSQLVDLTLQQQQAAGLLFAYHRLHH